ncbi:hypothetical protein [Methanococcus maripaludis]|uniref:DUF3953 domain-containing protein n=1 Tax=Methanococcus maripaludis TaxID=39152 RepID=A0A7J9PPA6_METMI|nr:hypothetical protein [Methanococcus maripaludis]MBA2864457.1 hypothetical protein [Methanococcus maripaludis]MBB6497761.1 hypothetical protein [Methanococcus maripaludis]
MKSDEQMLRDLQKITISFGVMFIVITAYLELTKNWDSMLLILPTSGFLLIIAGLHKQIHENDDFRSYFLLGITLLVIAVAVLFILLLYFA